MKTILCICALFACFPCAVPAAVITFDDLTGSGTLADGYGGINWGGKWDYYDTSDVPPYNPQSYPQRVYLNDYSLSGAFTFAAPNAVFTGAWFSGYDINDVSFVLFNDSVAVHTSGVLTPSSTPAFLASGYAGPVDEVRVITSRSPSAYWVLDDVEYTPTDAQVPEPGAAVAVATGMAALALLRRRRSSR